MADNDKYMFDSILGNIWDNNTISGSDTSGKFKTSDFLLDDILKEFGTDDAPAPSSSSGSMSSEEDIWSSILADNPAKKQPSASAQQPAAPKPYYQPSAPAARPAQNYYSAPSPQPTAPAQYNAPRYGSQAQQPAAPAPGYAPRGAQSPASYYNSPSPSAQKPAAQPAARTPDTVYGVPVTEDYKGAIKNQTENDKEDARRYVAELFGNSAPAAVSGKAAPAAPAAPASPAQPSEPVAPVRPIKKILSEREEENFKMRSGYIDINAIREATAARAPKQEAPQGVHGKPSAMDTSQRALFGKIGDFFSDATFQFDTSSVNNITSDTINGKPRRKDAKAPANEDEIKISEEIEDIYDRKDLPDVEQELLFQVNIAGIKAIITAVLALPLAMLNLFPSVVESIAPSLAVSSPFNHAIANLFILVIIGLLNFNIIGKGIAGLFKLRPTGSTLSALAMLASIAYCVYVLATSAAITSMYSVVAALSVVFVLLGKYTYYKNVLKNFEILAFDSPKTACVNIAGGYSLKELYSENEKISSCRPVDLITRFLANSFDYNFADKVSRVSIIGAILIIAGSVAAAVLLHNVQTVFALVTAACCAVTPLCYDLAYSLPLMSVSNKIRKNGSCVVSYTKASDFVKTTTMVMCDSDLFKPENIIVHSMKINGNDRINDVIINCASLMHESGSPVAGAFMSILDNKSEMLLPVYNFDWVPEKGFSGSINNVRYFIGSSQYLADCGIKLPTVDIEEKYKRAGRQVIMFADSTKLLAVFSISYCRDELIFKNLHRINLDGLNLLVLTRDANITADLMAQIYEMPSASFKIASKSEFERLYHNNTPKPKHPAGIYSITGATGITFALANCRRLISSVRASVVIRTLALTCSAAVLLVLCILSGDATTVFTPLRMVIFQLLWLVPPIFISMFAG